MEASPVANGVSQEDARDAQHEKGGLMVLIIAIVAMVYLGVCCWLIIAQGKEYTRSKVRQAAQYKLDMAKLNDLTRNRIGD